MAIIEGLGDEVTVLLTSTLAILVTFVIFWIRQINTQDIRQPTEIVSNDIRPIVSNENLDNIQQVVSQPQLSANIGPVRNEETINEPEVINQNSSNPVTSNNSTISPHNSEANESVTLINNRIPAEPKTDSDGTQIRIQYIDGRQRNVLTSLDDTIGNFKRQNFSSELNVGDMVRLIACGQELRDETSTLRNYGLQSNGVLHCLITRQQERSPVVNDNQRNNIESPSRIISQLFVPMLFSVFGLLWYVRIVYKSAFTGFSTFLLVAMTTIFIVVMAISVARQLHDVNLFRQRTARQHAE